MVTVKRKKPKDVDTGEKALAAVSPFLSQIPDKEVRPLTFEPEMLISVGLGYAKLFRKDRPEFEAALAPAGFDVREYDDMEQRAKAFWYANLCYRQSRIADRKRPVQQLVPEARALRRKMIKAFVYLWSRDKRKIKLLADIRKGRSHLKLAEDLGRLSRVFSDNWREARGRCSLTRSDSDRAATLSTEILLAIPQRETTEKSSLKETRNRAAEYLRRGIQEIDAAAAFLFRRNHARYERYPYFFTRRAPKKRKGRARNRSK